MPQLKNIDNIAQHVSDTHNLKIWAVWEPAEQSRDGGDWWLMTAEPRADIDYSYWVVPENDIWTKVPAGSIIPFYEGNTERRSSHWMDSKLKYEPGQTTHQVGPDRVAETDSVIRRRRRSSTE